MNDVVSGTGLTGRATRVCPVAFVDAHWRLVVPCDDRIGNVIETSGGPYEPVLLGVLLSLLSPGDLVVDVGANIGNHTVCLAVCAGVSVVAFEPNPQALDLLVQNVELNNLTEQVLVVPAAAGAEPGWASLGWTTPGNLGATGLSYGAGPLPVVAVDDLVDSAVKVLKVDVEGHEAAVLAGAAGLLDRFEPFVVAEAPTEGDVATVDAVLHPFGYRRWGYDLAATPTFLWVPPSRRLPGLRR